MADKSPLLSLVVPVYNVAPYLTRCLDSLLSQHVRDCEIVVVNDGSTDECPAILERYAAEDSRLRIVHRANGGLSAARNTGLDHARGRYLAFVDSDDFVARDLYAVLIAMADAQDLDMAISNAWYHYEERRPDRPIYQDAPLDGVMAGAAWLKEKLARRSFLHMVWMHLYRHEFLRRHGWRFPGGRIHEDVVWTTRALLAARRVAYDPVPRYFYRLPVRQVSKEEKDRRVAAIIASSEYNARALDGIAASETDDPELASLIRWQLVDGALSVFHKIGQLSSRSARRAQQCTLRETGFFGLLWRNAQELRQRRKIAHRYLKGLLCP